MSSNALIIEPPSYEQTIEDDWQEERKLLLDEIELLKQDKKKLFIANQNIQQWWQNEQAIAEDWQEEKKLLLDAIELLKQEKEQLSIANMNRHMEQLRQNDKLLYGDWQEEKKRLLEEIKSLKQEKVLANQNIKQLQPNDQIKQEHKDIYHQIVLLNNEVHTYQIDKDGYSLSRGSVYKFAEIPSLGPLSQAIDDIRPEGLSQIIDILVNFFGNLRLISGKLVVSVQSNFTKKWHATLYFTKGVPLKLIAVEQGDRKPVTRINILYESDYRLDVVPIYYE